MTVDFYEKIVSDLLQKNMKVSNVTSFASVLYTNSGKLSNKGWEYRIDWRIHESKDWRWNMDFNINRNVNTILEVPDNTLKKIFTQYGLDSNGFLQALATVREICATSRVWVSLVL